MAMQDKDYAAAGKWLDLVVADPEAPQTERQRAPKRCSASSPPTRRRPSERAGQAVSAKVAIIGRPNVGKSTLFNRLVGRKLALVDDQPGVTRDRREGEARLGDLEFTIVDTAGLEEGDAATLAGRMRAQTEAALADCDAILFVIDARAGDDAEPTGISRRPCAAPTSRSSCSPTRRRARRRARASTTPITLGLGEPIAVLRRAWRGHRAISTRRCATCCRLPRGSTPTRTDEPAPLELGDEEDGSEADPTKPLRIAVLGPPERRQVDAAQPIARRGPTADRPGAGPDPRQHRPRRRVGATAS